MTQVGKLFEKIPYFVRDIDNQYKDIRDTEGLVKVLMEHADDIEENDIINMYSNNRDNVLHFHVGLKNETPDEPISIDYEGKKVEFSFETFKDPRCDVSGVNSYNFLEIFDYLEETELKQAFDYMIGCKDNELFLSIPKEKAKLFHPEQKDYKYRNIILQKQNLIKDICDSFDVKYNKFFKDLTPNLIKQVCKDLNLTYKRLANELGYKPDTINKSASTGKVSEQLNTAIKLYLENIRLKHELKECNSLKDILRKSL